MEKGSGGCPAVTLSESSSYESFLVSVEILTMKKWTKNEGTLDSSSVVVLKQAEIGQQDNLDEGRAR